MDVDRVRQVWKDDRPDGTKAIQVWGEFIDGWNVFARLVRPGPGGVGYAVAEIRILPPDDVDIEPPGSDHPMDVRWNYEDRGAIERVPSGGIPFRHLRELREGDLKAAAQDLVDSALDEAWDPDVKERVRDEWRRFVGATESRAADAEQEWTREERLAHIAERYVELVAENSRRPNATIAEELGRSPDQVTQDIYRAREAGLLLPRAPGKGKVVEETTRLSPLALEILGVGPRDGSSDEEE